MGIEVHMSCSRLCPKPSNDCHYWTSPQCLLNHNIIFCSLEGKKKVSNKSFRWFIKCIFSKMYYTRATAGVSTGLQCTDLSVLCKLWRSPVSCWCCLIHLGLKVVTTEESEQEGLFSEHADGNDDECVLPEAKTCWTFRPFLPKGGNMLYQISCPILASSLTVGSL